MPGSLDLVFVAAAGVSVVAGVLVVTRRNPIHAAISLLVCFLAFAVIYLKLEAPFLAAMHVLVYTGAILVLFLFVIMLLNLKPEELGPEYPLRVRAVIAAVCLGLFVLLAVPLWEAPQARRPLPPVKAGYGGVEEVGRSLFETYGLPFELVSALILVAIFGGVLLARRKA